MKSADSWAGGGDVTRREGREGREDAALDWLIWPPASQPIYANVPVVFNWH